MMRATTKTREKIAGKFICLHRARVTTADLDANYVTVLDIPPKSADLNIIENILDELNRCVLEKRGCSDHIERT